MQDLSSLLDDMQQWKGDVQLALFCFGKELFVCRNVHSRGLDLRRAPLVRKYQYDTNEATSLATRSWV
jgi:hypothetical protein